jgi:hypothetical protein
VFLALFYDFFKGKACLWPAICSFGIKLCYTCDMGKPGRYIWLILVVFWTLIGSKTAMAQGGLFSKGAWGKVGVTARGVYKIDIAALNSMGLLPAGGAIASDKIRLFGSGGAMLPEAVGEARPSVFTENALLINDGGDGILSGQDFIVFYAPGPHRWHYDSSNARYSYVHHLYSDTAFYFLNIDGNIGGSISGTIGAVAKRVGTGNAAHINATAGPRVTSFTDNWVYEKDNLNVLASGKLWLGDAFSLASGGTTSRNYVVDMPGLIGSDSVTLKIYAAARSIGVPANFAVRVNNNLVQNVSLPAISGGFLDTYASYVTAQTKFLASTGSLQLNLLFSAGGGGSGVGFGAEGYLDKIECTATKALSMSSASSGIGGGVGGGGLGGALFFRNAATGMAAPAAFVLNAGGVQNFANTVVLDITDIATPKKMEGSFSGGAAPDFVFNNGVSVAREYVAFTPSQILVPALLSAAPNNNLHGLAVDSAANYLIITHPSLIASANKLAAFHAVQKAGIKPLVLTTTQMYQAFGSGSPDPTAIRDGVGYFARAYGALSGGGAFAQKQFYVLLLGASSYDYKNRINGNVNLVPGYQSSASLDPLSSYTSDDYFALLDSSANINIEPLLTNINATSTQVNIGRIPAKNVSEANTVIDKIINYHSATSQGSWRLQQRFIADDKDFNLHVQDAEAVSDAAQKANALFNQQKIYLDAYPLVSGSGGGRYPAVNEALVNAFNSGSLVINYSGHGNYLRLADEAIFSSTEMPLINNANKLPLVVTASCDFYPYDDPAKKSLGQQLLFGAGSVGVGSNAGASGAIALLTTPRLVFAYSNKIINENYFVAAHKPDANTGLLPTLGEAVKNAKNLTVQQSRDFINTRKFALLGDPAMRLAYPNSNIVLDSVNGKRIGANDTLVSGKLYTFKGSVMAPRSGAITGINNTFNGTLNFTLYDKQITRTTLKNDPATAAANFDAQENILYAGLVSVANGKFTVSFVLPLDISYAPGKAKISMYAQQTINPTLIAQTLPDAAGIDTSFYTMGSGAVITDKVGPNIDLFLNDYNFKNGGLTHSDPVLLINLQDVSGINTSSSAIGHDIIVTLDNNPATTRSLNLFYQANINTYQYGTVRYQLPTLTPGPHTLQVRAWDNVNNSNTRTLGFTVAATAGSIGAAGGGAGGSNNNGGMSPLVIDKVMNFPNPFTDQTTFSFEHNFPGQNIAVNLSIYTQNGKLVKQINKTANTNGTRNVQITWDGTDAAGSKIARNVYIYKIQISAAGTNYQTSGKLICL